MLFRRLALAGLLVVTSSFQTTLLAQVTTDQPSGLLIELNALKDLDGACRLTFFAQNMTEEEIEEAVFETVIFDATGAVVRLSLFDFRDLPAGRPRVRQFDLPGMACDKVGRALINGANSCVVAGTESKVCHEALSPISRVEVELLG